jgi:DNA repair ATPase RecN
MRLVHLAFALPILSGVAGGAYWGYDVLNRFLDVESGFEEVLDATSRIQALEQTVGDNDVANLQAQLSSISTNMATILEQQRTLLDLRSAVERATLITDGIDAKLQRIQDDIDSTWDAIDALEKPL